MKSIRQLSITIWDAVKAYCKRVADIQNQIIEFNKEFEEFEKQLKGDKK